MKDSIAARLTEAGMCASEAQKKAEQFARLEQHLAASSSSEPSRWFVPGRIEVLGKHTDYAGGRSLLCTAERGFCLAAVPRSDTFIRIHDVIRKESYEFELSSDLSIPSSTWRLYAAVVARRLARNFPGNLRGADIALASDLPSAAGMSSSSAFVVGIYAALAGLNHISEHDAFRQSIQTPEQLAEYLGCVENGQPYRSLAGDGGVGTFGGSEDHTAILCSQSGYLKQYSFCPVRLERALKLPDNCTFVIGVSGVVADKTGSAKSLYNRASLGVKSILDLWRSTSVSTTTSLSEAAASSPDAPDRIRTAVREAANKDPGYGWLLNRFEQFWRESEDIVPRASEALVRRDLQCFGSLVAESQAAAESLLGNQIPETIWLAREASSLGAHAASAFGAGFGGSVWALVSKDEAAEFADRWRQAYQQSSFQAAAKSEFFVTAPGPALSEV